MDVDVFGGFWRVFQRATASLFLLVVGVSLNVNTLNRGRTGVTGMALFRSVARRGLIVFLCGMVITFLTWLALPDQFVVFGILRLIGTSIVLAYPFRRLGV